MSDPKALVEELRYGAEYGCDADLIERAADAIEELVADLGDADAMTEMWMKKYEALHIGRNEGPGSAGHGGGSMSDYAKAVKQLRYCSKATVKNCMECEGYKETGDCVSEKLAKDAADAIEELMAQVKDKDCLIQQQMDEIERLRRDVKKQQEKMFELAKGLPKKGKWSVQYDPDDNPLFRRKFVCSACGEWTSYGMSDYCPNCGAEMERAVEV